MRDHPKAHCPGCRSKEIEEVQGRFTGEWQCLNCGLAFWRTEIVWGVDPKIPGLEA